MAVEWSTEVEAGAWLVDVLTTFGGSVASIVPPVFEAYARVFHPVDGPDRRWTDVAARNGRIAHPEMQYHLIRCRPGEAPPPDEVVDGFNDLDEGYGSCPRPELTVLADLLTAHTTAPDDCWFAAWEGWGQMGSGRRALTTTGRGALLPGICPPAVYDGPRLSLPGRGYVLLHGAVADAGECHDLLERQSPSLWWPADRAWCVATEVDFGWTYVGGTAEAVADVLAAPELEAMRARPTDGIAMDADLLNAALDRRAAADRPHGA